MARLVPWLGQDSEGEAQQGARLGWWKFGAYEDGAIDMLCVFMVLLVAMLHRMNWDDVVAPWITGFRK